jgi:hypothetical protein
MDITDQLLLAMYRPGRPALWTAPEAGRLIHQSPGVAIWLLRIAEDAGLVERVKRRFYRLTGPALALIEVAEHRTPSGP